MMNSLGNLFNRLHPKASSSGIRPQTEGLVSNIQIRSGGAAVITLLTERFPSPQELMSTEEMFESALHVDELFFAIESTDADDADIASYLSWAARHIGKSDPFAAALVRNASLAVRPDGGYGILFRDTGDCRYFETICAGLTNVYAACFGRDFRFIPQLCEIDLADEAERIYRSALSEAAAGGGPAAARSAGAGAGAGAGMGEAEGGGLKKGGARQAAAAGGRGAFRNAGRAGGGASKESLIWGRMSADLKPVPISELNHEYGFAVFEGSVFAMESRSVSGGSKTLVKYNVTDLTHSIRCFQFMEPGKADEFIGAGSKGWLRIYASVGFDFQFEKDLVAKVIGIARGKEPPDVRDNEPRRRVELHCHTKMSSRDSVCDTKELVRRAAHFGHEAIAITDHGVVQAFPDARAAQLELKKKGKSIKILYGIECYLADDGGGVSYRCSDEGIRGGFVSIALAEGSGGQLRAFSAIRFIPDASGHPVPDGTLRWKADGDGCGDGSSDGYDEGIFRAVTELAVFLGDRYAAGDGIIRLLSCLRHEGFRTQSDRVPPIKFYGGAIDTARIRERFPDSAEEAAPAVPEDRPDLFPGGADGLDEQAFRAGRVLIRALETAGGGSIEALDRAAGRLDASGILGDPDRNFHCVLLAEDEAGLYGIYRLVSESHIRYIYRERPRVPRSSLEFFRTGLIAGSACEAGEVFQAVAGAYDRAGRDPAAAERLLGDPALFSRAAFYDYLEIQPLGNNEFMLRQSERRGTIVPARYGSAEDLKNLNRLVAALAERAGIPLCATCDVHFIKPSDTVLRRILQFDAGYADAASQPPLHFRTTREMLNEFAYLGEETAERIVIDNPLRIAARIKADLKPFAEGSFPPVIESAEREIESLTWEEAGRLYGKDGQLPPIVRKRIEKELRSIIGNGFAIMYYIAHKLVRRSNKDGYLVGSRGSVGSSLVARLCGITEVNPLEPHYVCPDCRHSEFDPSGRYNSGYDMPEKACPQCGAVMLRDGQDIPFETFLGFEGEKQPDIDLNFSSDYQPVAHKFIEEMFGASHTFRAGTITGYAEKNADMMVRKYAEGSGIFMTGAEISRLAAGITGVKRTTSQHPGGIVVVPKDREIYDFTPVQCPADKTENGVITTHFDFNSLHDTILKLDILGHDDPTMLKVLGDMTGVDVNAIPVTDEKVMRLLRSADVLDFKENPGNACGTLGLPELGTFMARGMVEETKPSRFYDLVQLMGLSHGTDVWNGNARDLIRSGTCTVSEVIGCRDGIMTTLVHKGLNTRTAFGIMESVRKGKGLTPEQEKEMRDHGVPDWYIESCRKIKYMFPKAHAVAYTISALRIAWFKIYRPAEYYCAYFTVRADDFDYRLMGRGPDTVRNYMKIFLGAFRAKDKLQVPVGGRDEEFSADKSRKIYYILELVDEMHCRGIHFLPLDIYKSEATRFIMESETAIRPPLNTLPSLSAVAAQGIAEARGRHGRFISREDFAAKAGIGDSLVQLLEAQGCLDFLPRTTQMDLFTMIGR